MIRRIFQGQKLVMFNWKYITKPQRKVINRNLPPHCGVKFHKSRGNKVRLTQYKPSNGRSCAHLKQKISRIIIVLAYYNTLI
jgi:hypothetical protein